jgi:hypothetical protein
MKEAEGQGQGNFVLCKTALILKMVDTWVFKAYPRGVSASVEIEIAIKIGNLSEISVTAQ